MDTTKDKSILVAKPTLMQMKDAGMAFALICFFIGIVTGRKGWLIAGFILQLINMVWSKFFFILAVFWFSLANLLGLVSSKVLLTIIFYIVITPIGLLRRLFGYDSMKLNQWKKSNESVFKNRVHKFESKDLMKPY